SGSGTKTLSHSRSRRSQKATEAERLSSPIGTPHTTGLTETVTKTSTIGFCNRPNLMFITKSQLSSYQRGFSISNEYIAPLQSRPSTNFSFQADATVFLSHSHKDKDQIQPAIAFLRSHGVNIYVDWIDEGMPDTASGETAKKLKDRIKQQEKFLVLVTEN